MKNKALLYLRAKKDPSALLVEVLTEIEKLANIKLDKQAEESKEAITKLFKEEWGKLSTKATESIPEITEDAVEKGVEKALKNKGFLKRAVEGVASDIAQDVKLAVGSKVNDLIPSIVNRVDKRVEEELTNNHEKFKGERGESGIDGVGKDGDVPIAGIDYPTKEQFKDLIISLLPKKLDINEAIDEMDIARLARAFEALPEKEKLDYWKGLKNQPDNQPTQSKIVRSGGGGSTVQSYDLSSLLDGVTKTFTIPRNHRVLAVLASSSPYGSFRPTTDYTNTTTTITFTSEIDAPTVLASGQSVIILYVEG